MITWFVSPIGYQTRLREDTLERDWEYFTITLSSRRICGLNATRLTLPLINF